MLVCLAHAEQLECDLTVVIDGIKSEKGYVNLALCSSREQYYDEEEGYRMVRIKPVRGKTEYVFKGLPYGSYAIKVYHDKNGNNKLDTGFFGIPREGYGFSNDPKIKMGMPSFKETVFKADSPEMVKEIKMR